MHSEPFLPGLILKSRTHGANIQVPGARVFIKREDELSSGITGSKYRKLASLVPYILAGGYDEVILIGGSSSNFVPGALQFFNENSIKSSLFLLQGNEEELKGNRLLTALLSSPENIRLVTRQNWPDVLELAAAYKEKCRQAEKKVLVVPEGGCFYPSMPGAMTLADDILENETDLGLEFDHIFIDSGTGASAMGLLAGLQKHKAERRVHITLIAGNEADFISKYAELTMDINMAYGMKLSEALPREVSFYYPPVAKSFGSMAAEVLTLVKTIAMQEGILMDPVYSVKHWMSMLKIIEKERIEGNMLFIYNGGSLGLAGYQDQLSRAIRI